MRFTSLADWLGWLEQSHPKEIDLGLDRIRQVAARLDLLKPHAKVVTVAGTNGKGSCVTATAALLHAANFNVGVYTSPHLLHYNERIQINGKPVADEFICAAFEKIADACGSSTHANEISLTYFEYGTLAALEIFKQHNVDCMVLEIGLGGRLDAVNIIDADVAVITSIAIDHQDWLGDNREVIGREKAGILRDQQLFVCADEHPPQTILDLAKQLNTHAHFIGKEFSFSEHGQSWLWQGKTALGDDVHLPAMRAPHLPLPSMAAALQAIKLLNVELAPEYIEKTLLNLNLPGRFQKIVYQNREFILDVAHNPAATEYFSKRLTAEPVAGNTFAIAAMMSDKDRIASLANLVAVVDEWFLLDLSNIPRAASTQALSENLLSLNAKVKQSGDINQLMGSVLAQAQPQDRVVVFGSFFTVAAALDFLLSADTQASRGPL
ncbi:bifunctional folylpolyglutamate synthase/dihydrofolate synthase [Cellvibrio zantedeschiae]|uniref:Dihydrofolate synthase/folylpolyglutamate synthase n=1 Tax=Cellvibrio zantedeschiae TaxID=1237077 RepID=A0ABQ3B410_9GAMM|nr:bifunctional tetrahydrofolate synthase/dihydrofolate synthase [Cellvibrio zantedeschiae]GGY73022.1 bifunctional folylpolyglutamate synthase/dihydrofolate synthase [Cellvibrio zantedeschiae]